MEISSVKSIDENQKKEIYGNKKLRLKEKEKIL